MTRTGAAITSITRTLLAAAALVAAIPAPAGATSARRLDVPVITRVAGQPVAADGNAGIITTATPVFEGFGGTAGASVYLYEEDPRRPGFADPSALACGAGPLAAGGPWACQASRLEDGTTYHVVAYQALPDYWVGPSAPVVTFKIKLPISTPVISTANGADTSSGRVAVFGDVAVSGAGGRYGAKVTVYRENAAAPGNPDYAQPLCETPQLTGASWACTMGELAPGEHRITAVQSKVGETNSLPAPVRTLLVPAV